MKSLTSICLAGAMTAGALSGTLCAAEQKAKEEYKSTAETKTLVQMPLPGIEGKQVTIFRVTARPGWVGGKHYHTGPVYVYVLKGPFSVDEEGKATKTFETGQVYEEPLNHPMQARNTNANEAMELLVVQVNNQGEPLMYKVD
jgi:quercetin dioxygenase-like cupin family protein